MNASLGHAEQKKKKEKKKMHLQGHPLLLKSMAIPN